MVVLRLGALYAAKGYVWSGDCIQNIDLVILLVPYLQFQNSMELGTTRL